MKKILAVILAALLTLTVFVSCAAEKQDDGNVQEPNQEQKEEVIEEIKEPEKIEVSDFDDLMKKKAEAQKGLESFSADIGCIIDVKAMEEEVRTETDINMQADIAGKLVHTVVSSLSAELEEPTVSESYSGKDATYTKDADGEWFKHTAAAEESDNLSALIEKLEGIEFDASKYISDGTYEKALYNEKECYKASYTLNLKLAEMLADMGLEGEISNFEAGLAEELGPGFAAILVEMLSDLGTVSVVEYADVYTLYPVAAELDLTPALQQIVDKFIGIIVSAYGEGITAEQLGLVVEIKEFSLDMSAYGFNETTVVIPEEVLDAPEFTEDYLDEEQEGLGITFEEEYSDF